MDVEEKGIVSLWALMVYGLWLADYSWGCFFVFFCFFRYRYFNVASLCLCRVSPLWLFWISVFSKSACCDAGGFLVSFRSSCFVCHSLIIEFLSADFDTKQTSTSHTWSACKFCSTLVVFSGWLEYLCKNRMSFVHLFVAAWQAVSSCICCICMFASLSLLFILCTVFLFFSSFTSSFSRMVPPC